MAIRQKPGYQRKRRNAHNRKWKPTILVATEGRNKTETMYLRELARERGWIIRFVPGNYTDPVNMVNTLVAEYQKQELEYKSKDLGCCLIDSDFAESKNAQIAAADRIAGKHGVKVIVSSPCFEIWLLCHYSASDRQYGSNEEVLAELRKHLPEYEKNAEGIYTATKGNLNTAIQNAERLRKVCEEKGLSVHTVSFMPSTEMDEIAKAILAEDTGA